MSDSVKHCVSSTLGGRDVRGAPVIECHQRTAEQQAMGDSAIVHILKYLCRVPRCLVADGGGLMTARIVWVLL